MEKQIITLKPTDKLSYHDSHLFVNNLPFEATSPDESVDWIVGVEDNQLITNFKGRSSLTNKWSPEEISGFYVNTLNEDNKLIGGIGDATAPSEIDPKELSMGVAVEMAEHTHDPKIATEIAIDHLTQDPHYYTKLNQAGLTDEFSHVSPSGYGDPDSEFNTDSRLGNTVTCAAGNNIVGGMDKTPDGHIDGKPTSTPIINKTVDINVTEPLQEAKKWIQKAIHPSKMGMYKNYTSSELQSALSKAKKASKAHKEKKEKVPHQLRTKLAQLVFAIRAKSKKRLTESKDFTRTQIEEMLKKMLDINTEESNKKAIELRNKLINEDYMTTEDILKENKKKMIQAVHAFAKKHFMNEKLVLRRKDDKIYVISDDTKEKEKPFKEWETVRNKAKLRAAGFSYDGVGWWIYATKLKEAQEIIAKINDSPIEKFIDKLEDLLEFEQETKDFDKKEELATKIEGFIDKLASEVDRVKASDAFRAYINFASKFYSYSFNNILLIYIQRPNATKVGSFSFWKKINRHVKKGAKAIWIYKPITVKDDAFDGSQTKGLDAAVSKSKVVGFAPSMVFDIADTEASNEKGDVPESPKWHGNDEPEEKADKLMEYGLKLADNLGIKVDRTAAGGSEKGWASKDHINVVTGIAGAGALGTLIHEIAHSLMHFKETSPFFIDRKEFPATKEEMELEAETVSYVVLNHYGLDAQHHPVYLASWKANKEAFQKSLKSITRVSKFIITELDKIATGVQPEVKKDITNEPAATPTT